MNKKVSEFKKIRKHFKDSKKHELLFVLFTVFTALVALVSPLSTSAIQQQLSLADYDAVITSAIVLFVFVSLNLLLHVVSEYFFHLAGNAIFSNIRTKALKKTLDMKLSTIYNKSSGYFLERLNEDTREVAHVRLQIYRSIINIVVNIGFITYLAAFNLLLGLIFFVGLVILIILEYIRINHLLKNRKKQKKAIERVKSLEAEYLKGIKEIKGLRANQLSIAKYKEINGKYMKTKVTRETFTSTMNNIIAFFKALLDFFLILFSAIYLLPRGEILIASVLLIYSYKNSMYGLITSIATIKDLVINAELSASRLNEILEVDPSLSDNYGDYQINDKLTQIEFKNVEFYYDLETPILKDINFIIDSNGLYGFLGKSGSGKSTIFSLLTKFNEVITGDILLNGVSISKLDRDTISRISIGLQDPYIFNDTIRNNLILSNSEATDEMVIEATKKANIYDEIMMQDQGFETVVGESGSTISGGQKQRIEIARVLLKKTDIYLFDEATSALDKNNLEIINNLLKELSKTSIVLVIAHRLGVMRLTDKIFLLDNGAIVGEGKHSDLLLNNSYYQELYKKSSTENVN